MTSFSSGPLHCASVTPLPIAVRLKLRELIHTAVLLSARINSDGDVATELV